MRSVFYFHQIFNRRSSLKPTGAELRGIKPRQE
jgi:hypothetical protein